MSDVYSTDKEKHSYKHWIFPSIMLAWTVFAIAMTSYWALLEPLNSFTVDTSKKGKPKGVLLEGTEKGRAPFDIQSNARGHWTVVVFAALTNENVGYSLGNVYTDRVNASAEEIGTKLTALGNLLRNSKISNDVEVWIVRVDPHLTNAGDWRQSYITNTCKKCSSRLLEAAHTRGGKHGNYYDNVYQWLIDEWYSRHIAVSKVPLRPGTAPATAILDPDGDLRTLSDGLLVGQTYTTLMSLIGKETSISRDVVNKNLPYQTQKKGWLSRFTTETLSLLGTLFMFIVITTGLIGFWRRF